MESRKVKRITVKRMLVTGSNGLIGSEIVRHFHDLGWEIDGVDNNMRADFFGPQGDTRWNQARLLAECSRFTHHEVDIRSRADVAQLLSSVRPDAIVHTAAQPSHDLAAKRPFDDFDVNAMGTLNLLEFARQNSKESPFIYLSTNKVYGDSPNSIPMKELPTRWDYDDAAHKLGISENCTIDQSKHSLFGASKVAADVMAQEYGRYFGLPTCCLRGGCLTGAGHSGVELHGFLSYLIKINLSGNPYTVFGYKGKQVRDIIHSSDVAKFVESFIEAPRCGEVYNLGGGKENSISVLEAFAMAEDFSGQKMNYRYTDEARIGDHICYYSDLTKMKTHYPRWSVTKNLAEIFREIVESWKTRSTR